MVTVNVQANAVKGRQAHEVATEICRSQKWKDGHEPASIKIELAPCARGCFASSRDAKRFEQAVHRSATAHQHVAAH